MTTISQRELRNNSAEIMRGLKSGESFTITSRGEVVGRLTPASGSALDALVTRRATRRGGWSQIRRAQAPESTSSVIDELRADRV